MAWEALSGEHLWDNLGEALQEFERRHDENGGADMATEHGSENPDSRSAGESNEVKESKEAKESPTRPGTGFRDVLLVVASLLLAAVLAEGASRAFYWFRWDHTLYPTQTRSYHLRLGWRAAPGVFRSQQINSSGFRRPTEVTEQPSSGTTRVFLIGGSTAFGSGSTYTHFGIPPLRFEETIDHQLETILNERHPESQFEVINAATTEHRLYQEITLLTDYLANLGPSLVVFLDGHNDMSAIGDEPPQPAFYWNQRHLKRGERVLNARGFLSIAYFADLWLLDNSYFYYGLSTVPQRVVNRIAARTNDPEEMDFAQLQSPQAGLVDTLNTNLPFYLAQVRDLRAIAETRGLKVVYALQPEIHLEDPADLNGQEPELLEFTGVYAGERDFQVRRYLAPILIREIGALATEQFRFVDLTRIADRSDEVVYTDYTHLTGEGNRLVAEGIYEVVRDLWASDADQGADVAPEAMGGASTAPTISSSPGTQDR